MDTDKPGFGERDRIDVHKRHELDYWTRELGVDVETLKATVNRVGPMVERVRLELSKVQS